MRVSDRTWLNRHHGFGVPCDPPREVEAVEHGSLPVEGDLVRGIAVVVGVALLVRRQRGAGKGRVSPVAPDGNGACRGVRGIPRLRCGVRPAGHEAGREVGLGLQRGPPVVEGVAPSVRDAWQPAQVGEVEQVPSQEVMDVGQRLRAIGGGRAGIGEATGNGGEARPDEARPQRAPEGRRAPLKRIVVALGPGALGVSGEQLPEHVLPAGVSRGSAKVEPYRKALHPLVARVGVGGREEAIEVLAEAGRAGAEQHPRRGEGARLAPQPLVAVRAISGAGGAVGGRRVPIEVALSAPGCPQRPVGEGGVARAEQRGGGGQVPDRPRGGQGPHLTVAIGRHPVGQVRAVTPVVLLARGVPEAAAAVLHREEPLQPPARLVEQIRDPVARLGDVPIVVGGHEVSRGEQDPEER